MVALLFIGLYALILVAVGYRASRHQSVEGFLIADRRVSWVLLAATLSAGYVGGGFLVMVAAWAFRLGWSVLWVFGGSALGFLVLLLIAKRLRRLSDEHNFYTLSDYVALIFGVRTAIAATLLQVCYFFSWLLLQFVGGGVIISGLIGISYSSSVLLLGGIILAYLLLAGFAAVVQTDLIQYFMMLVLLLAMVFLFAGARSFSTVEWDLLAGVGGASGAIGLLIVGSVITSLSGDMWQRIYSGSDIRNVRIGLVGAAASVILFGLTVTALGLWARLHAPQLHPDLAFTFSIGHVLPAALLPVSLLVVVSSIMSSADTILFALSMSFSHDLMRHLRQESKEELVRSNRRALPMIAAAAMFLALIGIDVSSLGLLCAAVILPLGPTVLGSFIWSINERSAFWSIVCGTLSLTALFLTGLNEETVVLPFFIALLTLILLEGWRVWLHYRPAQ